MNWRIYTSKDAEKFIGKNKIPKEDILNLIELAILYFRGERVNLDIDKLKGKWAGFYRIRKGKIRIIAEFNFVNLTVFIEEVDFRGNVYK